MRYAEARGCAHRVRITAYTGCAAALIGGSTTTSLRGGGRYGKGSKAKLQEQFADAILLIVDEHSMLSLDETGRLLDAVRTGQSRDTPGGDLAMLFLGDFAQYPPVGCENLAFGSSYKDTEKGTAREKVLAAFESIRKGKGKVGGNDRKAASMFEGWTFWRSMGAVWVLTEQFRAENDVGQRQQALALHWSGAVDPSAPFVVVLVDLVGLLDSVENRLGGVGQTGRRSGVGPA